MIGVYNTKRREDSYEVTQCEGNHHSGIHGGLPHITKNGLGVAREHLVPPVARL
jgi:hypothetical protein